MSVAIIDYGSGNLHSAAKAFERASRSMEDPQKIMVTRDPEAVYRADRIVLPGVGAFADCRRGLDALDGMLQALTEAVRVKARPPVPSVRMTKMSAWPAEPVDPYTIHLPSGEKDEDVTVVPRLKCVSCASPVPSGWMT